MVVQEPSEQLLVKARQVICLVEEAVATVGADTGTVPRRSSASPLATTFDLDVDADLGS